jgi:hypothetical protein
MSFVSLVLAWQTLLPDGSFSQGFISGGVSIGVIKHHVHYYINLPAAFFDGVPHYRLLYGASIPLAIAGAISRYRSDHHAIIYVILTFLLYILWPPVQGLRFLFPILPFYMSFVLSCLGKYKGGIVGPERILRKVTCILPVLLVLLYFGKHSVSHAIDNLVRNRTSFSGPFVETSRIMFSYIEKNIETKSTVVFFKPRAMRMMTGRRSLMINKVGGLSDGDYLSFYQSDKVYLDQILPDEVRCLAEK